MAYLIQFEDLRFNYGPVGTELNGIPVVRDEATRYATRSGAELRIKGLPKALRAGAFIIEEDGAASAEFSAEHRFALQKSCAVTQAACIQVVPLIVI